MSEQIPTIDQDNQSYGDLTALNTCRLILDSVGGNNLGVIAKNYIDLLGTSGAVYEANGDYALGLFSSGWCRYLDNASRQLCDTNDNAQALKSKKWICHESCWRDASLESITTKQPADVECQGGLNIYAVPIMVNGEAAGSLNVGYGTPPSDPEVLQAIAERYKVSYDELCRLAQEYKPRSEMVIDAAKSQLRISANLIGKIIEKKQIAEKQQSHIQFLSNLEKIDQAIRQETDAEKMLWKVLNIVLSVFDCDRVWLLYPCDPEALTWRIPVEVTRPEYPGAFSTDEQVQMTPDVVETFKELLSTNKPVSGVLEPGETEWDTEEKYGVQSFLSMAVYPTIGKPWDLGLHQCSFPRIWSEDEVNLFKVIGQRIGDALSNVLTLRSLRESEEKFRQIAESIKEVFWVGSPDWDAVYYISPTYEDIWGRSCQSLYEEPMSWLESIHPDDLCAVTDALKNRDQKGSDIPSFPEFRIVKPDGSVSWILARAFPVYSEGNTIDRVVGIAEDITDRKLAEAALQENELRFRNFFNESFQFALILDMKGNVSEMNDLCSKTCGSYAENVIGNPFWEAGWWKQFPDVQEKTKLAIEQCAQGETVNDEVTFIDKENTVHHGIRSFTPIMNEHGVPSFIAVVGLDITDRILAEKEKEQLQSKLQQAVKMQAVGTMAGGIAHEFNNMLSIIMGCTEMARDEVPESSFAQTQLDMVMQASYRVKDLVKQILTFSNQSQQKKISANLCQLVRGALKLIWASIPSSVEIVEDIPMECATVHVDPAEIQQIIMNLCSNAVWAMNEKGTIAIRIQAVEFDEQKASDREIQQGRYLELMFSDSGCGMDEVTLQRIFDPFFTQKEVGKGTGMGLSIVYSIMESYGGTIMVESEVGKGTTLYLYFPVTEESDGAKSAVVETGAKGKERILLVDDEQMFTDMEEKMLGRLGYDVDAHTDSIEALEAFKAFPDSYDLIITDQIMPKLTGEELAREARSIKPDIPIILCTGYSSQIDDVKARSAGIDALAFKPLAMKEMAKLIQKVLDLR